MQKWCRLVSVGVGFSIPPYINKNNNNGIEQNIIKEAFRSFGFDVVFRYYDMTTLREYFSHGVIDVALHMHNGHPIKGVAFSQPHIAYHNVVIGLKSANLNIHQISQLKSLKVMIFNNATDFLGSDFAEMAANNPNYQEKPRDSTRVFALQSGLVDAIVMDLNIYKYLINKGNRFVGAKEIEVFDILEKTHYRAGFHNKKLLRQFDIAIASLKSKERYNKLLNSE